MSFVNVFLRNVTGIDYSKVTCLKSLLRKNLEILGHINFLKHFIFYINFEHSTRKIHAHLKLTIILFLNYVI